MNILDRLTLRNIQKLLLAPQHFFPVTIELNNFQSNRDRFKLRLCSNDEAEITDYSSELNDGVMTFVDVRTYGDLLTLMRFCGIEKPEYWP